MLISLTHFENCTCVTSENNLCAVTCFYVDDMLIFGSNIHVVNNVKKILYDNFSMKDLE